MDTEEKAPPFRERILNHLSDIMARIRQLCCLKSIDVTEVTDNSVGSRQVPRSKTSLSLAKNMDGGAAKNHYNKRGRGKRFKWLAGNGKRERKGNKSWAEKTDATKMKEELDKADVDVLEPDVFPEGHVTSVGGSSSTTLSDFLSAQSSRSDDWGSDSSLSFSPMTAPGPFSVPNLPVTSPVVSPRQSQEIPDISPTPCGSGTSLDSRQIDSILDELLEETSPPSDVFSDTDLVAQERVGDN